MNPVTIITPESTRINAFCLQGEENKPCVLFFHPDPASKGDVHNNVIKHMYNLFHEYGFSVLRMSLPEIKVTHKKQKLTIVPHIKIGSACLQWFKDTYNFTGPFWVFGVGYGTRIAMQLFMRIPEVNHFMLVNPYITFSDINHVPHDNISGTIFTAEGDKINEEYLPQILKFLRENKSIYVNHIKIKGVSSIVQQEGLIQLNEVLRIILDTYDEEEPSV